MHEKLRKVGSRGHHPIVGKGGRYLLAILVAMQAFLSSPLRAQAPLVRPIAGEALRHTPLTLSVDQQPLGELMRQLFRSLNAGRVGPAGNAETPPIHSFWLDRHVDSEMQVSLVAAATPAAQVFQKIASDTDLAVFPVPGVLIVGRPQWVDMSVTFLTARERRADPVWVRWPTGSTAAEVLGLILSAPTMKASRGVPTELTASRTDAATTGELQRAATWLPLDIWQGGELIGVDRTLAAGLVLAQFELSLKPGTLLDTLLVNASLDTAKGEARQPSGFPAGVQSWTAMGGMKPFPLAYPVADSVGEIRELLAQRKPRSTIREHGDQLLISATATNHRGAIAAHWSAVAPKTGSKADSPSGEAVFDLKLINKPAAAVLAQLAAAAGKRLRVEPAAIAASEQLVSLDAAKKTLQELAEQVARSAGLAILWSEDEVVLQGSQSP